MVRANGVKRVVIEVPEGLRIPPDELEERLRVELALRLYEKGIASLGQARRIAGLSKWDFLELLAREGIPIHYGEEELKEDLEAAKRLTGRLEERHER
jgi:predicted HTH domain antitoxin